MSDTPRFKAGDRVWHRDAKTGIVQRKEGHLPHWLVATWSPRGEIVEPWHEADMDLIRFKSNDIVKHKDGKTGKLCIWSVKIPGAWLTTGDDSPWHEADLTLVESAPQVADQPPPLPATGDVWLQVIDDMHERRKVGIERYKTPLQPFNGRNAPVDLFQELLDACVYARQWIEERRVLLEEVEKMGSHIRDVESTNNELVDANEKLRAEVERLKTKKCVHDQAEEWAAGGTTADYAGGDA